MTFDHPPRVGHVATVGAVGGFVGAIAAETAGIKPAGTILAGLGGMYTVAGQAQLFRNVRDDNSTSARPSIYTSPATHPAMTPGIAG